jgi:hypothetical protein
MSPSSDARDRPRTSSVAFMLLSLLLHAAVFFAFVRTASSKSVLELKLPDEVEFGLVEPDPGSAGAPKAASPEVEEKPKAVAKPVVLKAPKPAPAEVSDAIVVDGGVKQAEVAEANTAAVDAESAEPGAGGQGVAGEGLGFGSGGFGTGKGGAVGAVIGLYADIDQIKRTALVLETRALLQVVPEWQKLLVGSGIDPMKHLSRVFVATPNLTRADLVVSARFKGGQGLLERGAEQLAQERGQSASFRSESGLKIAPWYSHGPTEREVALVAPNQFVIAKPRDVPRVLAVSAALARRHQKQEHMEHAEGPAALLAMYEGEAAALAVEGARKFVVGENESIPLALRISIFYVDEFHTRMHVFGYYESEKAAASALERIDELRHEFANHPRVIYFGLKSALLEAELQRVKDTLELEVILTLHQTRYLLTFVANTLKPRD